MVFTQNYRKQFWYVTEENFLSCFQWGFGKVLLFVDDMSENMMMLATF